MRELRGVRALGALGCAVVALGVLLGAWLQQPPELDEADAREVAERSLAEVGYADAEVDDEVARDVYEPSGDGEPIDSWRTVSRVEGGTVELWVAVADGAAVFLLDRTEDETGQLLTDDEFEELRAVRVRPQVERQVRRNIAVSVSAAGVVLTGVALASIHGPPGTRRPTDGEDGRDGPDGPEGREGPEGP